MQGESPDRLVWLGVVLGLVYAVSAWPVLRSGGMSAPAMAASSVLGAVLLALSIIDVRTFRLPDWLTLPLLVAGLTVTFVIDRSQLVWHAAAALAGYGMLAGLAWGYRRLRDSDGMGLGDAKLLAAAGAWLGLLALPTVLLWACLLSLTQAGVMALFGAEIGRNTRLAFGPALALAFWVVWLYGPLGR